MVTRSVRGRVAFALVLMLPIAAATTQARADTAAATSCASGLAKDAKAIFDASLPQIAPGIDLRDVVTANTRKLAIAGTIDRGTARDMATAAAVCLKHAET
jgi:hypothetical protein